MYSKNEWLNGTANRKPFANLVYEKGFHFDSRFFVVAVAVVDSFFSLAQRNFVCIMWRYIFGPIIELIYNSLPRFMTENFVIEKCFVEPLNDSNERLSSIQIIIVLRIEFGVNSEKNVDVCTVESKKSNESIMWPWTVLDMDGNIEWLQSQWSRRLLVLLHHHFMSSNNNWEASIQVP